MQTITINLIPNGIPERVYVNQYDVDRRFAIEILDGQSSYSLPQGATLRINGRKADNCIFDYGATEEGFDILTVSGGQIIVHTTMQMVAAAGECLAQITIEQSGQKIGTLNFIMDVQEMPMATGEDSESELPDIIALATEQMLRAEAAADNASASETSAASSASAASTSETNAAASEAAAEDAATRAEAVEAHPPRLDPPGVTPNGNWWVWDNTLNPPAYKDSGVDAGVSCDVDPNTVTLPAGSSAAVQNTGTQTDPRFKFSIPQGAKGDTGDKGDKGDKGDTGNKGDTGTSVSGMSINANNHLIITLSDGTTLDAGAIPTGGGSAVCNTSAGTAAKVADFAGYVLRTGNRFPLRMVNANTASEQLTLNVNSTGAKPVYINGTISSATNYTLPAGDYDAVYDGTAYQLRLDAGLNGKTVGRYNNPKQDTVFEVGSGTADNARHNALEVKTDGLAYQNESSMPLADSQMLIRDKGSDHYVEENTTAQYSHPAGALVFLKKLGALFKVGSTAITPTDNIPAMADQTSVNELFESAVFCDDDEAVTPVSDPEIKRSDLAQTLQNSTTVPPSSAAVKTVTDSIISDLAPYLSSSSTGYALETAITPGQTYTVPNDGWYLLECHNDDANHTRSAAIALGGANLVRNSQSFPAMVMVPLKKNTILSARANTSGSTDNFKYTLISRFS